MRMRVRDIRVGNRIRSRPGDLTALAESMRRVGLLQPILVDEKHRLVAGFRRLEAAKRLGWESIDVRVVEITDKKDRLLMEADENVTRRDFTPEELARADRLLLRYSRVGIFGRLGSFFADFFDRLFRR